MALCFTGMGLFAKSSTPDSYAYTRGVEAYQEDNYQEAYDWFNRELADNPGNGYAHVYMGIIRLINEDYGKAISELEIALKKLPKKDKTWRALTLGYRSDVYAEMEDTASALRDLEQAIKLDPQSSQYYKKRAQIYYEQKNYALSDADYDKLISLDPGGVMGYMGKGRNADLQNHWDEAIALFTYVTKLAPEYSSGYSYRAETFAKMEKWNEATDDLIRALDIDGDEKAFYGMLGLPDEEAPLMKSKLKLQMAKQPSNRYWPYCIAMLDYANDEYEEAIEYFQQAHKMDANSIFLERIASSYMNLKQYEKALDYANRALAMSPQDYDFIRLKASILSRMGRYDESLIERDKVIANEPENVLSYFSRANDLMNAHKFDKAIEDYNTMIVLVPGLKDYPYLLMRRGDAYRLTGRKEMANVDYNNILLAEKDSVLSSSSRTPFAYSGLGDAAKAVETMQFIVDTNPEDLKENLYNLASIYARVGMKQEAVKSLKRAVDNGYDDVANIKANYDLDCIRELPEFISLVASLEPKTEGGDESQDELDDAGYEVVEVPFSKDGGVTKVQCTINGLPLHFVFDTGAADVTMSMVEASFMLKNDYIKPTDVVGSARYMDANGDISEGTVINLRNVNFGGLELDNVRASVVRNQKAPLLLGQSVLGRLGKIEIDNSASKLKITHKVK